MRAPGGVHGATPCSGSTSFVPCTVEYSLVGSNSDLEHDNTGDVYMPSAQIVVSLGHGPRLVLDEHHLCASIIELLQVGLGDHAVHD
jgi:hypothetical protein